LVPNLLSEEPRVVLLHVSNDATRELYEEINRVFSEEYRKRRGVRVIVQQSHGGSGKQARAILDGLPADIVSLALDYDVEILSDAGIIEKGWQERFPWGSHPYSPAIVFLVRKGNPKGIRDWEDLARPDVVVLTPNPKTSGGARWNYLAGYAYARKKGWDESRTLDFLRQVFTRSPVMDTGARGTTFNFVERKIGDVSIVWENEAILIAQRIKPGEYEVIYPSVTILAECPATYVDRIVEKKKTREYARAYLEFLFSAKGQEIIARHGFRPSDPEVFRRFSSSFPPIQAVLLRDLYKNWREAYLKHFAPQGTFDLLLKQKP
jgi:sulfate transport system substrate-binding protein